MTHEAKEKHMTRLTKQIVIAIAALVFVWAAAGAALAADDAATPTPKVKHGAGFIDLNGDGINDNAPDHDNDGIPNGQDPDFKKGTGQGQGPMHHRYHQMRGQGKQGFVDANGDGFNDNAPDHDGDGIPNGRDPDFVRGAGMGRNAGHGPNFVDEDGDGICDNWQDRFDQMQQKKKNKGKK
jgi:hypothetical protein